MELLQYEPKRPYARASRVGDHVFLAGEAGYAGHRDHVVEGGIVTQAKQAFENIRETLEIYGLGFEDLARMDVFLLDGEDKQPLMKVLGEYLPQGSPPGALVVVKGFAHEGVLVEIECIAATTKG